MQYGALAWAFALFSLLAIGLAARLLINRKWFLAWLRGTVGLLLLVAAAGIAGVAYDLYSYRTVGAKPLATISFKAVGPLYQVMVLEGAEERQFSLEGELWQLQGRLWQWRGLAQMLGLRDGYRLQALQGRYLSIEQQNQAPAQPVALARSPYGIDLWQWLHDGSHSLFVFETKALQVNFLPMANDAVYTLSLTPTGLLAEPLNQAAQQALQEWH
ncbi:hypothetical protein [Pseudomonas sp. 5P_3.1_Bac2]|uniref:hypothetical protein n=1 Tax=Pseudomonas sp. 5P_3.1_Bac2 TaxID=2971617 RepID=UPI0021C5E1E4|nr:hypothetical protein [Pseudomonas sp. 5P_3.1_Bac2]MCU1717462.1 hypothetical protein [Pseudomonas sp. 5P_3.1_Bac2]